MNQIYFSSDIQNIILSFLSNIFSSSIQNVILIQWSKIYCNENINKHEMLTDVNYHVRDFRFGAKRRSESDKSILEIYIVAIFYRGAKAPLRKIATMYISGIA